MPDMLPFADKPVHLPTSITLVCRPDAPAAEGRPSSAVPRKSWTTEKITTELVDDRLYVNWTPGGDIRASAVAVG